MMIWHDSRNLLCRTPGGAQPTKSAVTLRIRADAAARVTLRVWWENREYRFQMTASEQDGGLFEYTLKLPTLGGLLWYYFIIESEGQALFYGNAEDRLGGEGRVYQSEPPAYQITVYDAAFRPPEWMKNGIMYQIMPDRFHAVERIKPECGWLHGDWNEPPALNVDAVTRDNRADDFFGGNLKGIAQKLDYLEKLGVTVIYLNPIFRAHSNHKSDTGDYETIDLSFGTQADFESLCARAREKGIRIMLDGVFSHTGSDSR